jgi:transcriptional regulator with XRE-family HTH domain
MKRRKALTAAFGHVVREARANAGLSQEKLAFRAGVHPTYISQIERGLKSPSLDVVSAIAKALGERPSLLLKRSEEL